MKVTAKINKRAICHCILAITLLVGGVMFSSVSYADVAGQTRDFTSWSLRMMQFIEQIKYFVSIVATIGGMWFLFTGLADLKKHHHGNNASQGNYVSNGLGKCATGAIMIAIVPMMQMLTATVSAGAGTGKINNDVTPYSELVPITPAR